MPSPTDATASSEPAPTEQIFDIVGQGFGGEGFARVAEGFVSLPRALPGDRVEAEVGDFLRGRAWGRVVRWLARGPGRVEPDCPHYDECSGCALRHVSRVDERAFKLDQARGIWERYGPGPWAGALEWVGGRERLGHRARGAFQVAVDGAVVRLGLRGLALDRGVVDVRDCPAQSPRFRALMVAVGEVLDRHGAAAAVLTRVAVETAGERARLAVDADGEVGEAVLSELRGLAAREGAVLVGVGGAEVSATLPLDLPLGEGPDHLRVHAPLGAWHHAAPAHGSRLADWVFDRVAELGAERAFDLCCGLGRLTARLAPTLSWLVAIDEDRAAVEALGAALAEAGMSHVRARAGRVGSVLRKLRRDRAARAELAVVNPMRRPLGPKQLRDLPALGVRDVVYCGPAPVSAARDAAALAALGYRVERVAVVDLHPGTAQFMLAFVARAGGLKPPIPEAD